MTDEQIKKALECCISDDDGTRKRPCNGCPLLQDDACSNSLRKYAFDLINRQKAEIERLKEENRSIKYCYEQSREYNNKLAESCEKNCKKFNMTTRAEAIKEFAERFKEKASSVVTSCQGYEIYETKQYNISAVDIDNLVKEMVGEE